jgi:hypothetical protein
VATGKETFFKIFLYEIMNFISSGLGVFKANKEYFGLWFDFFFLLLSDCFVLKVFTFFFPP